MKNRCIKLIVLGFVLVSPILYAQQWSADMYDDYSYKSFKKFPPALQQIDPENIDYMLLNAAVYYATNEQRIKHGRKRFSYNASLEAAASGHSNDMNAKNFFSHSSKVKGKYTMERRLALQGIKNTAMGENIAETFAIVLKGNESYIPPSAAGDVLRYYSNGKVIPYRTYIGFAQDVLKGWMNSPGHRSNILDRDFTRLGCGTCLRGGKDFDEVPTVISTQNFSGEFETKEK